MSIFLIKSHLQEPREDEEPRKTRVPLESAKDESPFSQNVKRTLQESRGIDFLFSSVCILPQKSSSWSCALRSCTPASSSMSPTSAKAAKMAFTSIVFTWVAPTFSFSQRATDVIVQRPIRLKTFFVGLRISKVGHGHILRSEAAGDVALRVAIVDLEPRLQPFQKMNPKQILWTLKGS